MLSIGKSAGVLMRVYCLSGHAEQQENRASRLRPFWLVTNLLIDERAQVPGPPRARDEVGARPRYLTLPPLRRDTPGKQLPSPTRFKSPTDAEALRLRRQG